METLTLHVIVRCIPRYSSKTVKEDKYHWQEVDVFDGWDMKGKE